MKDNNKSLSVYKIEWRDESVPSVIALTCSPRVLGMCRYPMATGWCNHYNLALSNFKKKRQRITLADRS